ncbi:hypothetical protein AAEO57_02645 [Flavobacterium sp. DGU38]|uniref:Uncharacterized protein n=1 Tax=Flavobacterium calami TaxID=3139144 RepID=A0ABU9IJP4_9FLAO
MSSIYKIILKRQSAVVKKEFEVVLINYANDLFKKSQKINSRTGKKTGSFTKIISYNPNNIDAEFRNINKKILEQKRGDGYWLWKPYFIKKTLEDLKFNDFLFYCDSGSYFVNSIEDLISLCHEKNQDIIPFELSHTESHWTKRDAFILMNCDSPEYFDTKQRLASFILIKKTERSLKFMEEWLNFAEDERILTDIENKCGFENYQDFREHRHDQSIFSLLTKKYGFTAFKDPSQNGNSVEVVYPDSNYKEMIVHNRKRNYPVHIRIKKYLQRKKQVLKNMLKI